MQGIYGEKAQKILEIYASDLPSLRDKLISDKSSKVIGVDELFEFPYLKRYPLLKRKDGSYCCWHPIVFSRGVESIVHLKMSDLGQNYVDDFSKIFEKHVKNLAPHTKLQILLEEEQKNIWGKESNSVEAIAFGESFNILIEAKMAIFEDSAITSGNSTYIYNRIKRVREAINQGQSVSKKLRKSQELTQLTTAPEDILLIVTNRDLSIGTGLHLEELCPQKKTESETLDYSVHLPSSNIFIVSIDEYEILMEIAQQTTIDKFLGDIILRNKDPKTKRILMSHHLAEIGKIFNQESSFISEQKMQP